METIQISQSIATTVVDKRENLCFIGESYVGVEMLKNELLTGLCKLRNTVGRL